MTITGYRRIGVRIDSVQVIKLRVKLWGGTFSTILHLERDGRFRTRPFVGSELKRERRVRLLLRMIRSLR
jgi:hypothetical protein